MKIVIIGAGIIGLMCAYRLHERGHSVVLLDADAPGAGSSDGNTGWIVPVLSGPIPAPGLELTAMRWIMSRDSPLRINLRDLPWLAPWLWQFRSFCNDEDYSRGLEALGHLNRHTLESFDELRREGLSFEMYQSGLMFVARNAKYLEHILEDLQHLSGYGFDSGTLLDAKEVRDFEPKLSDSIGGGVYVSDQRHLKPESLIEALVDRLRSSGILIYAGERVRSIEIDARSCNVKGVNTTSGRIDGDMFLVAAGAWSGQIARMMGIKIPIRAGIGYSVNTTSSEWQLKTPLYLTEAKVACSPFTNSTRFAGLMELSRTGATYDLSRCDTILRAASQFLDVRETASIASKWAGMRPLTPDGLPVIGRLPGLENGFIASGHAMLGVTMAPVTAKLISDMISRSSIAYDTSPVDPSRFLS